VTKVKKVFESLWYWSLPSHPIRKFENATPIREVPWRPKDHGGEEVRYMSSVVVLF
jgi:hypothetical protein